MPGEWIPSEVVSKHILENVSSKVLRIQGADDKLGQFLNQDI